MRAAALALALGVVATPAGAQAPVPQPLAPVVRADADRDRIADDLEQRLAPQDGDERVDVIVTLADPASRDRVGRIERGVGNFALRDRFRAVEGFAARVTERQVAALAKRPGVVSVERDAPVRALNDSAQAAFGVAEARLDNPRLDGDRDGRPASYSRRDMVAAVIDTGIDARHRDLNEGKVIAFADCSSGPCRVRRPYDDNGHGTHVAGTLAGEGDARADRRLRGVAPGAGLVGVKVLGAGGYGSESRVIAGIDWTIANRARYGLEAANISLASGGCSNGTDAMSQAANRAVAAGLVVTAAAGNSGPRRCTIESPAAASGVIAVGTMADFGAGGFFAHPSSARGRPGGTIKPDVMAPGERIVSARRGTSTGYATRSGTSQAAPFVAGVALLMRDAAPSLPAGGVSRRIKRSAVDWGIGGASSTLTSRGPDLDFGWGRLDAYAALRSAGAAGLTSAPLVSDHRLIESRLDRTTTVREFPLDVANRCMPLAAGLVIPGWTSYSSGDDFDLYLTDPDGRQVDASQTSKRQESISVVPARTGRYTLRVESYAGEGPFFVDVSAGLAAPPVSAPASCR
ncbi:MAG: S8 family serine peptidase [Thermoleophilaceae bacterium]|nr:S8 family serine peptidase [Thermoleophilaceae bacterium]